MTEESQPQPRFTRFFYGWVIVVVGALLTFLGTGFYAYSRGVFLPALSEELADGSRFQIAMGFSVAAITSAFLGPFVGKLLDNHSPRHVILFGIVVMCGSYLLLSSAQTIVHFYLIVGLGMGVGMTCMGSLAWHRTIISWFDHWRGRAIALSVLGASLAGVVMPPLVTMLVDNIGWRSAFDVFAAVVVCTLLPLVWFFLKDRPEDMGEVRDGHRYVNANKQEIVTDALDERLWHWKDMLRHRAFWSIALIFGAMGCVYSATMLHLFGHSLDIGLSSNQAALVLSMTALFAALGKPVVGWMADAWGSRITIWMALIAQGCALLTFAYTQSFAVTAFAGCLYGFGYAGMSPLRTFALSVTIGNRSFGNANGVLRIIELPLVISASPLAGFVYDSTGSYQIAFLILAGLMAVSCVGPFFIRTGGARERRQLAAQQADR